MSEDKSFLKQLLTETWPARMAQDALKAVMLPGDVYQGKVSMYGEDGRTNPEVINRSADLAGLVTLGAGAVPAEANSLRSGIKAYHGSPHDFERFDMSKIGTGEGAQVYGHGLYFADNEAVARSYRDAFAQADMPQKILNSLKAIDYLGFDTPNQAIRAIRSNKDWMKRWDVDPRRSAEEAQAIGNINKYVSSPRAHMYEVNINADPARFLDWDKPVSINSPLRERVADLGMSGSSALNASDRNIAKEAFLAARNENMTGSGLYHSMTKALEANRDSLKPLYGEESLFLKPTELARREFLARGIPGIKYLDQGSRYAGGGTSNYVVFDDKLIDILRKYGLAGASASPLAALMAGQGQGELQQ